MRIMDRIVTDLHLGSKPAVSKAFVALRRRGYVVLSDATRASFYWVNGTRLTAFQLVALAVMRGLTLRKRR